MRINLKKFTRAAVIAVILTAALSVLIAYAVLGITGHKIVKQSDLEAKDDLLKKNEKIYEMQDDIEKHFLFDAKENDGKEAMAKALAESLGDDYSEYMSADELKAWEEAVNSGFTGIGITCNASDGRGEILSIAEDGPADAAELEEGDVITKVDGKEFETEKEFLKAISGRPGKTLHLEVLRGWYTFEKDITIAEVEMRSVTSRVVGKNTGYIRITTFSSKSSEEFAAELKSLEEKGVRALILDLRGNGGGYVDQGIKICDMILPECTIGFLEDKDGKRKTFNSDEESCSLPLAVLVDEKTASASEIVTAAIKGNKAGTIVGQKTFGKGLSQTEFMFKDGSCLKLTTARYLTPSGKIIDGKGIAPDEKVKQGDEGDRQLKKAVALLK